VAGRLTAVDLALAKPLGNASAAGLLEQFPNLQRHFGRVSSRPSHTLAYSSCEPGLYRVQRAAGDSEAFNFQKAGPSTLQ
jgi:glutathione S-transferase